MATHRVLLTGANGFLGAHILKQLLPRQGITVRAVVRSQSKINNVKQDFGTYSNLDFAIVPDITTPDAFHNALSKSEVPFDTVIHTASPFVFKDVKSNHDFLDPAVKGTKEILNSIKAVAPSVVRVIITSSFAAMADLANPENMYGKVYTDEDWNPVSWSEAVESSNARVGYQASKKFAEEAAWAFVKEQRPNFNVVTICPPMIYGPLAHTVMNVADLNESTARIYNNFINSKKEADLPPDGLYLYADVRDVATAHIASILTPEAAGNRFLVSAGQISSQQIADTLRATFSELEERTPKGKPGSSSLPVRSKQYDSDAAKAKKVLGIEFRPVEDTLRDLGKQLLELKKSAA